MLQNRFLASALALACALFLAGCSVAKEVAESSTPKPTAWDYLPASSAFDLDDLPNCVTFITAGNVEDVREYSPKGCDAWNADTKDYCFTSIWNSNGIALSGCNTQLDNPLGYAYEEGSQLAQAFIFSEMAKHPYIDSGMCSATFGKMHVESDSKGKVKSLSTVVKLQFLDGSKISKTISGDYIDGQLNQWHHS